MAKNKNDYSLQLTSDLGALPISPFRTLSEERIFLWQVVYIEILHRSLVFLHTPALKRKSSMPRLCLPKSHTRQGATKVFFFQKKVNGEVLKFTLHI